MTTVSLTPAAVANLRRLQDEFDMPGFGLRFGITGGGCSGYKYVLELEEGPIEGDEVIEITDDVKVFLHEDHREKLQNSTIDWIDTLMETGFRIDNPQAKNPCGCGESVDF
ncbi:MAG: iron-sulfur cluster assembly accessory protein [Alphaproteobacteria bacterium]|nr:iron-sulfur cluster assembly accessory protein [Alphaproteobacteria bacterium]